MNANKSIMLVGLLAMTALLAGCTSNQTSENIEPSSPITTTTTTTTTTGPTLEEQVAALTETVNGPSDISNYVLDQRIFELEKKLACIDKVGYSPLTGEPCFDTTTTTTTTVTTPGFPPAPDGVKYFKVEVDSTGCSGSDGRFYSPGAPNLYVGEWFVNTGSNSVGFGYDIFGKTAGDKTMATNGEWNPISISSDAFNFCFFTEAGQTATIALAYPPPQKG